MQPSVLMLERHLHHMGFSQPTPWQAASSAFRSTLQVPGIPPEMNTGASDA